MAVDHYRLQWCSAGPYLLDCHRANGVAPVDGCRHCQLLNRPPKAPAPSGWRPWQAPGGALKAKLGKDPMPEWGAEDARRVLAAAYGGELAEAAYIRCRKMASAERYAHARYHRRQDYVSIAALQAVERPSLRQASPGEVSNAVRNAIVEAERYTSLNGRHLTRVNGKETWQNSLDTWLLPTQGDDSGNTLFDDLTAGLTWREGYSDHAEWQEQANADVVDTARREYLLWEVQSRLDEFEATDLTGWYAFRFHEVEGKSYREVATILGIGKDAARRASERVKGELEAAINSQSHK